MTPWSVKDLNPSVLSSWRNAQRREHLPFSPILLALRTVCYTLRAISSGHKLATAISE